MLSITGLNRFYFLPHLHDMRCKAPRISEIIKCRYNRNPCNGDVYIYMSKDYRRARLILFESHAYHLYEKTFERGYRFVRITLDDDVMAYHINWQDLVAVLETPVMKALRLS